MSLSDNASKLLNAMAEDDQLPGGAFRDVEGICEEFMVSYPDQGTLADWLEELCQEGAAILEDHELHVKPTPPFMASITLHGLDMAGYLSR
ncbi:hypothetical protein RYZ26_15130 [Terasakiella sp. A23]|uniref:hypothetical protein n=1 Tax=Terasakiella sp. FCG-A23 TaxID=3080561 RepID=UPI00295451E4|nr:hypothetical protein [Terasakiella sp. A23]MDV7340938.1 hypothetical protein [Terasakiella sp. A23]